VPRSPCLMQSNPVLGSKQHRASHTSTLREHGALALSRADLDFDRGWCSALTLLARPSGWASVHTFETLLQPKNAKNDRATTRSTSLRLMNGAPALARVELV
jgi:hypothetical protein